MGVAKLTLKTYLEPAKTIPNTYKSLTIENTSKINKNLTHITRQTHQTPHQPNTIHKYRNVGSRNTKYYFFNTAFNSIFGFSRESVKTLHALKLRNF
jgi:hypothetical protein